MAYVSGAACAAMVRDIFPESELVAALTKAWCVIATWTLSGQVSLASSVGCRTLRKVRSAGGAVEAFASKPDKSQQDYDFAAVWRCKEAVRGTLAALLKHLLVGLVSHDKMTTLRLSSVARKSNPQEVFIVLLDQ